MAWHYDWSNTDSMSWSDKYENAEEIWDLLINTYGWTEEASAAVISNFQHEGLLNPAQWQIGSTIGDWDNKYVGLGLGQWSPASKIGDYCGGRDRSHIENGAKQVECTVSVAGQWVQRVNSQGYSRFYGYSNIPYYRSISDFSQATDDPEDLATCWCACWEGCSKQAFKDTYTIRREDARYWYEEFRGGVTGYPIVIKIVGNGSAIATPSRGIAGTSITIRATPNGNDTFIGWTVIHGGITLNFSQNPQTFIMPNNSVTLYAEFTGVTPQPKPFYTSKRMPLWFYPPFLA